MIFRNAYYWPFDSHTFLPGTQTRLEVWKSSFISHRSDPGGYLKTHIASYYNKINKSILVCIFNGIYYTRSSLGIALSSLYFICKSSVFSHHRNASVLSRGIRHKLWEIKIITWEVINAYSYWALQLVIMMKWIHFRQLLNYKQDIRWGSQPWV